MYDIKSIKLALRNTVWSLVWSGVLFDFFCHCLDVFVERKIIMH